MSSTHTGLAWRSATIHQLWDTLNRRRDPDRPLVVGIDGRSGAGKSALAADLAGAHPRTAVVHTDDLAWHHSFFGWTHLLIDHLLEPFHDGRSPIRYTPQAWRRRGRCGAIEIPAGATTLLVEGVGVVSAETRRLLDAAIWVHTDHRIALQRVLARKVDSPDFLADWMRQEEAVLAENRPWASADLWVRGEASGVERGTVTFASAPVTR
jgi:hypothetical protein